MDDFELKVQKAINTFENLQLKYTVDSLDFFINNNVSVSELRVYSDKNMLLLLAGGLKEKTFENAKKVLTQLLEVGLDLETIHALCKEKCYEQGFSLGEVGMQILTKMSEDKNKQTIAAEPFLQNLATMVESMNLGGSTQPKKRRSKN